MKSYKLILSVLSLVAFAAAPVLRAQTAPTTPPPAGAPEHKGHDDRLKELAEKLNLTDDQKAKIKPIIEDEMKAMKALKDDTSIDKKAKHEKEMEIRKSHADQILALLTPEQQEKFKDMIKAMHEKHGKGKDAPAPVPAT